MSVLPERPGITTCWLWINWTWMGKENKFGFNEWQMIALILVFHLMWSLTGSSQIDDMAQSPAWTTILIYWYYYQGQGDTPSTQANFISLTSTWCQSGLSRSSSTSNEKLIEVLSEIKKNIRNAVVYGSKHSWMISIGVILLSREFSCVSRLKPCINNAYLVIIVGT